MMKKVSLAAAAALALAAMPARAQQAVVAELPVWLAGTWAMEDGANWSDEFWTQPRGGMMLGAARTGFGPELQMWESTRIERKADGTLRFIIQPRGGAPKEFPAVFASEVAIEFANPAQDYPQRIRYELVGQLLITELSKLDGSDAVRWQFRPLVL